MTLTSWRDEDIEGAVIGAMLLRGADPEVMEVISSLPAAAFAFGEYRQIYQGICAMARSGGVIDPVLLCGQMPGSSALINASAQKSWSKSSLKSYAAQVRKLAALREAQSALSDASGRLVTAANSEMAVAALADVKQLIASIETESAVVVPMKIDDYLNKAVDLIEARMEGRAEGRTVKTGIDDLDQITGGFDQTDLIILAARPSMGKTEAMLDITERVTASGGGVLFFSLEMSGVQIVERQISAAGGISATALKAAERLNDEDWARIFSGVESMTGRNIWIVDASSMSLEQICQAAVSHKLQHPEIALIGIDYLGLIKVPVTARHDLAIGEVSKGLKALAKQTLTPVIALSQLSRGVETRANKRPMNADLKNSGEVEADADVIMMLYRDEVYNPESPARGIAEINVTKNRNGNLGTVYRRFHNGHFYDIDQAHAASLSREQPAAEFKTRRYARKGAA